MAFAARISGRMLVQMLGVFAEFEREVIIDRVIAGMERKAAKGLWTGGTTPIGYVVDKKAHNYVIVEGEAAIVRRIFDLYTKDRLGTRAIASVLNDGGLRTKRGKPWSQRSVETVIINRHYLGEKSFRDIVVPDAHPAIITDAQFNHAQHILTRRSEEIGQRAANASEYTLTGKIPCPQGGSKYIGTVAHGRNNRYRYYMCWSRNRYGANKGCDIHRFNADELEAPTNSKPPSAKPCSTSTPPATTSSNRPFPPTAPPTNRPTGRATRNSRRSNTS
jgi:site-specific DNA recombinase